MTLDQCYNFYKGLSVNVDGNPADTGQCVQWADVVLAEVYGMVTHYGNAIDWYLDPRELLSEGFERVSDGSIKKGDFVVFGTGVGSQFGHIDVAAQDGNFSSYVGWDSNWGHDLTVHTVNHNDRYNQYILGVLRLKGGTMADKSIPTSTQVGKIYPALTGKMPTQDELNLAVGLNWYDWLQYLLPGVQTLRDTISNLESDRDNNLYPTINAVTQALGLPVGASREDITQAIGKLKNSGVSSVKINGQDYVPR